MTDKLTTRDIITTVLMSMINIIIFGFGSFFYLTPVTILLMPVFYALFQGIVFFMLATKVRKKGTILLYCIIMGVIGFNIPYILMHIIAGIIAEVILAKKGYTDPQALTLSYIILQLLACIGSTIYPYALVLDSTLNNITTEGDLAVNVAAAGQMIQSWGMLVLALVVILTAWIGALMGKKMTMKHMISKEQ